MSTPRVPSLATLILALAAAALSTSVSLAESESSANSNSASSTDTACAGAFSRRGLPRRYQSLQSFLRLFRLDAPGAKSGAFVVEDSLKNPAGQMALLNYKGVGFETSSESMLNHKATLLFKVSTPESPKTEILGVLSYPAPRRRDGLYFLANNKIGRVEDGQLRELFLAGTLLPVRTPLPQFLTIADAKVEIENIRPMKSEGSVLIEGTTVDEVGLRNSVAFLTTVDELTQPNAVETLSIPQSAVFYNAAFEGTESVLTDMLNSTTWVRVSATGLVEMIDVVSKNVQTFQIPLPVSTTELQAEQVRFANGRLAITYFSDAKNRSSEFRVELYNLATGQKETEINLVGQFPRLEKEGFAILNVKAMEIEYSAQSVVLAIDLAPKNKRGVVSYDMKDRRVRALHVDFKLGAVSRRWLDDEKYRELKVGDRPYFIYDTLFESRFHPLSAP